MPRKTETLTATVPLRLNLQGEIFRVVSAPYTLDLIFQKGGRTVEEVLGAEAGYTVLPKGGFDFVTMTSAQGQSVSFFYSSGSVIIDRIAGDVTVVDGARGRVEGNSSYFGTAYSVGGGGQFGHAQLWNPAGSGFNAFVTRLWCWNTTLAGVLEWRTHNATVGALYGSANNPLPKKAGGTASALENRASINPTRLGNFLGQVATQALNQTVAVEFTDPIMLPPGFGLHVCAGAANGDAGASFDHFTVPVGS